MMIEEAPDLGSGLTYNWLGRSNIKQLCSIIITSINPQKMKARRGFDESPGRGVASWLRTSLLDN